MLHLQIKNKLIYSIKYRDIINKPFLLFKCNDGRKLIIKVSIKSFVDKILLIASSPHLAKRISNFKHEVTVLLSGFKVVKIYL